VIKKNHVYINNSQEAYLKEKFLHKQKEEEEEITNHNFKDLIHGIVYLIISFILIIWGIYKIEECYTLLVPLWFISTGCVFFYVCLIVIIRIILIKSNCLPQQTRLDIFSNILRLQLSSRFRFSLTIIVITSMIGLTIVLSVLLSLNSNDFKDCYAKSFIILIFFLTLMSLNAAFLCFFQ
jgi:hypothetical protein